VADGVTLEM